MQCEMCKSFKENVKLVSTIPNHTFWEWFVYNLCSNCEKQLLAEIEQANK